MKRAFVVVTAIVLTACHAGRQRAVVPAPMVQAKIRVATLDVQKVALSSPDGLDAAAELHRKFDPDKERLDAIQQEIVKLRREPGNEAKIADLGRSYRLDIEERRQNFEIEQKRIYKEISDNVIAAAGEYAKQERFAVVVDVSEHEAPLLWRADEADVTDITEDVLELLKAR